MWIYVSVYIRRTTDNMKAVQKVLIVPMQYVIVVLYHIPGGASRQDATAPKVFIPNTSRCTIRLHVNK